MLKNWIPAFAGMTVCFLFSGCNIEPPKPPLVETVAVLPFDSESNDLNAPEVMQSLVYWALKTSPYRVSDIKDTNEHLAEKGVVDGGQLPALDPVKIGKDLGVQALLYGYITNFDYTNVGFYRSRKVGLELKLVDVATGATLWENSGSMNNTKMTLDSKEAGNEFVKGVADQATDKLFKTPLEEEAKISVQKALRTLPGFHFAGFESTPHKSNPLKDSIRNNINDDREKRRKL